MTWCRVGAVCASAAALALIAAPAARACNEPGIDPGSSISPRTLGPGDPGSATILDTDQGAEWTLRLPNGQTISGVDDTREPGTVAYFTMPDLGGEARAVTIKLTVSHAGEDGHPSGPWTSDDTVQYRPPAAAQPEPQQPAAQQGPTEPAGAPAVGAEAPAAAPATRARERERSGARSRAPEPARQERRAAQQPVKAKSRPGTAGPVQPRRVQQPTQAARPLAGSQTAPVRSSARRAAGEAARPQAQRRAIRPPLDPQAVAPRASTVRRAPPSRAAEDGSRLPLAPLAVLAALVAAATLWIRARRRGAAAAVAPPPPDPEPRDDLALEAELQEIVAEQRAGEMTGDDHAFDSAPRS